MKRLKRSGTKPAYQNAVASSPGFQQVDRGLQVFNRVSPVKPIQVVRAQRCAVSESTNVKPQRGDTPERGVASPFHMVAIDASAMIVAAVDKQKGNPLHVLCRNGTMTKYPEKSPILAESNDFLGDRVLVAGYTRNRSNRPQWQSLSLFSGRSARAIFDLIQPADCLLNQDVWHRLFRHRIFRDQTNRTVEVHMCAGFGKMRCELVFR